jgi:hypothetical protein
MTFVLKAERLIETLLHLNNIRGWQARTLGLPEATNGLLRLQ